MRAKVCACGAEINCPRSRRSSRSRCSGRRHRSRSRRHRSSNRRRSRRCGRSHRSGRRSRHLGSIGRSCSRSSARGCSHVWCRARHVCAAATGAAATATAAAAMLHTCNMHEGRGVASRSDQSGDAHRHINEDSDAANHMNQNKADARPRDPLSTSLFNLMRHTLPQLKTTQQVSEKNVTRFVTIYFRALPALNIPFQPYAAHTPSN